MASSQAVQGLPRTTATPPAASSRWKAAQALLRQSARFIQHYPADLSPGMLLTRPRIPITSRTSRRIPYLAAAAPPAPAIPSTTPTRCAPTPASCTTIFWASYRFLFRFAQSQPLLVTFEAGFAPPAPPSYRRSPATRWQFAPIVRAGGAHPAAGLPPARHRVINTSHPQLPIRFRYRTAIRPPDAHTPWPPAPPHPPRVPSWGSGYHCVTLWTSFGRRAAPSNPCTAPRSPAPAASSPSSTLPPPLSTRTIVRARCAGVKESVSSAAAINGWRAPVNWTRPA